MRSILVRMTLQERAWMRGLAARRTPTWLDRSLRQLTHAGGAVFSCGACMLLLAFPETRALGLVSSVANLGSHLLVQALKRTVVRARPSASEPTLAALIASPDAYSFPSGHACAAIAVALPVVATHPVAGMPVMILALLVGFSRFYLRVHYLTDVLVGQLIGALSAVAAGALLPPS